MRPTPRPQAPLVCVADILPEAIEWLWNPYVPFGQLTLVDGAPGDGQRWISLSVASYVSSGQALPNSAPMEPGNVLLLNAEDGLADTVRPRLDAMGADASRIYAVRGPLTLDGRGLN